MIGNKKLFGQDPWDLGTGLVNMLSALYRFAFAFEAQEGAENITVYDLKSLFLAQGEDITATPYLSVDSYGDVFILNGTGSLALIDRAKLKAGGYLSMLIKEQGVTIVHNFDKNTIPVPNRPANFDTLVPISTSTGADYVSFKENEPFDFRLIFDGVDWTFHDWSRNATTGSVTPDSYIAEKAQEQGIVGDATTQIIGFADAALDTATFYGDADTYTNDEGNVLFFGSGNVGALTGIQLLGGEKITFTAQDSNGKIFGVSDAGNVYMVMGTATVGYSNNGLFLGHNLGGVSLSGGGFLVNNAAKAAQIEV